MTERKGLTSMTALPHSLKTLLRSQRTQILLPGLACFLVVLFILDLASGSVAIPPLQVLSILLGEAGDEASWRPILLFYRLPKAVTAVLAGAGLGLSGLQMQTLFRNPLASPGILGINSGASLGVACVILGTGAPGAWLAAGASFSSSLGTAAAAGLGSAAVLLLVLAVAHRLRSPITLLVLGLMFGYLTTEAVSLLLYFSRPELVQAYFTWTFGSFAGLSGRHLAVITPAVLSGLVLGGLSVKPLNAFLLGEEYARSMGLSVMRWRLMLISGTALMAGAVTAFCGPISFLGVAVPHLCRGLFGTSDHRVLVPAVAVAGAASALAADLAAQLPGSALILPVNTVTALIGAPVVMWVILRRPDSPRAFR